MDPILEGTSSHFDFLNAKLIVAIYVEILNMAYKLSVGALQGAVRLMAEGIPEAPKRYSMESLTQTI